jgi:hypothetical protein
VKKSDIEVCTAAFERSHGKRPGGRGSWAFTFGTEEIFWVPGSVTYGEARKVAIARALEIGSPVVEVCT